MDVDAAIARYLRNPDVARWLFCAEEVKTVSAHALDSSFVYSIGFGSEKAGTPRTMNIEDMLIVTGRVGSFVLGFVWGLSQPHVFARTPLMLDKKPLSRRFAVDFSARDSLEFMEFVLFEDGKVIVMFRQFLHTLDLALPVVACARLHNASQLQHTLGPVLMRADIFEAASCPACGLAGKQCRCSFASYAPNAPVRKATYTWNQYASCFMQKARVGTVKLKMTAVLPNVGEMAIVDDDMPVLNVLQRGDTEYMGLMKRKAVHGLGISVVMPRADQLVMAASVENDFLDLHNSYVTRKRERAEDEEDPASILLPSPSFLATDTFANTQRRPESLDFTSAVDFLDATKPSNSESIESVDDVLSIFPSIFSTAESPRYPGIAGNKAADVRTPLSRLDDELDLLEKSKSQDAEETLLMDPHTTTCSDKHRSAEEERQRNDIVNSLELILSPDQSNSEINKGEPPSLSVSLRDAVADAVAETEVQTLSSASCESVVHDLASLSRAEAERAQATLPKRKNTAKRAKPRENIADSGSESDKKHACTKCSSRFKMRGDLLRHVKIVHEGKKMFTCETCGKAFGHSGHLNRHVSSVHLHQRRFKCNFCGFHFYQQSHLQSHIGHIHGAKKLHECKECGYRAPHQVALAAHTNDAHKGRPAGRGISCPSWDCSSLFDSEGPRDSHVHAQHQELPPANVFEARPNPLGV